jgi:hypothetical protein
MPTGADRFLLDASGALPLVLADHEQHEKTFAALAGHELGLAGQAAFETFSVLTRLPGLQRLSPAAASRLLATNFPHTRHPSAAAAVTLLGDLSRHRLAGAAVYDALVGVAAVEHGAVLVKPGSTGAASDGANLWHTRDVFVLDFGALVRAPQRAEHERNPRNHQARALTRVRIPPSQVFELMKALELQLSAWEKETGKGAATR